MHYLPVFVRNWDFVTVLLQVVHHGVTKQIRLRYLESDHHVIFHAPLILQQILQALKQNLTTETENQSQHGASDCTLCDTLGRTDVDHTMETQHPGRRVQWLEHWSAPGG